MVRALFKKQKDKDDEIKLENGKIEKGIAKMKVQVNTKY